MFPNSIYKAKTYLMQNAWKTRENDLQSYHPEISSINSSMCIDPAKTFKKVVMMYMSTGCLKLLFPET